MQHVWPTMVETDAAGSLGVPTNDSPPGFLSANITVLRI
jgi:hypothetical protein